MAKLQVLINNKKVFETQLENLGSESVVFTDKDKTREAVKGMKGTWTLAQINKKLRLKPRTLSGYLSQLVDRGVIQRLTRGSYRTK
jgi:predicted transcriptional regulator of viral defense system